MKKLIGSLLAMAAFVVPASTFAATLNGSAQDNATLRVVNYTMNASCLTCWSASATANSGDVLSFAIYYHNTGTDTATNVRVRLTPQTTNLSSTHTFYATVSADNAPAVTGSVIVTTTSSQTISFLPGSAFWYPNRAVTNSSPLPPGQQAYDLFNGVGVNIGNIAPGWESQGSLVVRFQSTANGATSGSTLPAVTTNNATSISQNGATLNGYESSNGTNVNTWFEWGTTQSFGNTTPITYYGTGAVSFNSMLYGLMPNTTYYYRAVASNGQGTVYGNMVSFTTGYSGSSGSYGSIVTTNSATSIAQDSAILNGYVTPNGSNTNAWFEWGTTQSLGNATPSINYGTNPTSFNNTLYGLMQNTTYYYRAVANNGQGNVYGTITSFMTGNSNYNNYCGTWGWGYNCGSGYVMVSTRNTDTSGDFAVLNGYVDPNGTNDTVRWFEWGGSQSFGNSTQKLSQGNVASNFSATLTGLVPNTTYYYRAAARNSQGTVYGNALSFTTSNQSMGLIGTSPTVTTLFATEINSSNAKLNGFVFTSANQPSNAWFEWGTNASLGNKTESYGVGSLPAIKHSEVITGLVSGQTYYYRIVAENPYGKVYGTVNSFVAQTTNYVPTPSVAVKPVVPTSPSILKPTTVVVGSNTAQSLVALSIDGGAEAIGSGEKRTYHVSWKNESAQALKNVVLRVTFPASMTVDSATKGSFSSADNSVLVDLKNLAVGENGDTFIFATTDRKLEAKAMLVITANMVYTGSNGIQGDAIAYATHIAEATPSVLGASVFGAGEFLPTTLFEWTLLITMVLALVLLGNHLYGRFSGPAQH